MAGLVQEFRTFAVKGNAMDMAVGIILGAAFNKVVNSIVQDLLMPPIGLAVGGVDFRNLKIVLKDAYTNAAGTEAPEVAIRYGAFISVALEFLIVALSIFVVVKAMNHIISLRDADAEQPK